MYNNDDIGYEKKKDNNDILDILDDDDADDEHYIIHTGTLLTYWHVSLRQTFSSKRAWRMVAYWCTASGV